MSVYNETLKSTAGSWGHSPSLGEYKEHYDVATRDAVHDALVSEQGAAWDTITKHQAGPRADALGG